MKRVLVLDAHEDIRTILVAIISSRFGVETVAKSFREVEKGFDLSDFSLVISDVQASEAEGFWLHLHLLAHCPQTQLILFVSPEWPLRKIPAVDSVVRAVVPMFDFGNLVSAIQKSGVLG